ncbi:MAG: protein kinase [Pirellulales bacterium]|nr:protein kinase [Pirellulales bacterium]
MAPTLTAEKLAQRALDVGIISEQDLQSVWSELGTRNVEYEQLKQVLVRRGLLTNYQLDRIAEGFKTGFFYGPYKVQYCVGAGTFARVYRACHRDTNELFAVKVLRKRFSANPQDVELFRREGELGEQLKHDNIVAIHEVVSKGGFHYIVMDFVEGRNLRDFYKVRGKFEPEEATRITEGIVAGLNYAFQKGVSHRDLKMSNVIVSSDGVAKLVDFGLAGLGGEDGDDANPRTIDYAGLERATNVRKDDARSDIFFVGCMFYQMLSGKPPLAETRERSQRLSKSRYQNIPPIAEVAPKTPLPLARVVQKAIEFDPARRYQTPGEMLADVKLAAKRLAEAGPDADAAAANAKPLEGHGPDGEPRRLMVVESDTKMQDLFRELFKKCGYRVLVTSDPDRLFARLYDGPAAFDGLLISTGTLGRGGVDAFNRLGTEVAARNIPAVLLLGDGQGSWKADVPATDHRRVLAMPVRGRELREALLRSFNAATSVSS